MERWQRRPLPQLARAGHGEKLETDCAPGRLGAGLLAIIGALIAVIGGIMCVVTELRHCASHSIRCRIAWPKPLSKHN